jgi:thiol-disulfide isomerase/thioredoxin
MDGIGFLFNARRIIRFLIIIAGLCLGFASLAPAAGIANPGIQVCAPSTRGDVVCSDTPAGTLPGVVSAIEGKGATGASAGRFTVYFFWGNGCPHCADEKPFLEEMKKLYPQMQVRDYEVWYNEQNAQFFHKMAAAYGIHATGVPVTIIGRDAHIGFSPQLKQDIMASLRRVAKKGAPDPMSMLAKEPGGKTAEREDEECRDRGETVNIPMIGKVNVSDMSLPFMTIIIAGLDSFNPCAFFVLFSLLGLLVYAQSRKKMFLIGSVFVFFSGFIYFLFMAAWLNLFLVMGQVALITTIAGVVSVIIAVINIKDFFMFNQGVSLTIPDSAKPKLFDRMRKLMKSTSLMSVIIGTAVLAIVANSYELLCTAGFPMVFTRILTLNNLSAPMYYFYLAFYNVVYVIPLAIIVVVFTITLGKKKLTEWQGRVLKLVSGMMMLGLGAVLIIDPVLLNNMLISAALLAGALAVSAIIIPLTKRTMADK